jgi:enoyl-CoA hydratase/carnithine racemase
MTYTDIRFEVGDGIAVITLQRPDQLNAFTGAMGRDIETAYRHCDEDDAVRAVILTGAGRAFCAGADLSGGADAFQPRDTDGFSAAAIDFPAWRVRKPVIAAVNGSAVGLGLTLALQCDLRVVAREGKYGILQVRRGMIGDAYSHWTLPRIVGLARAADILLTGRTFDGDEALALGIANRVVAAGAVLSTAMEIARDIAANTAPLSVALSKQLLWESFALWAADIEQRETDLHRRLMAHPDAIEGPMAYLEKRPPRWSGSVARDLDFTAEAQSPQRSGDKSEPNDSKLPKGGSPRRTRSMADEV